MSGRILFRATLSTVLLILAAGPDLVRGSQDTGSSESAGVSASPGASAPWFMTEVDTGGDIGLHASVANDPSRGAIYVSYYDASNQVLRLARSDGLGPDHCGPNGEWGCHTVDSGPDVGKHRSVAVNPKTGGIGVAYYDATNGNLKYLYFENPHLLVHRIYTIDKGTEGVSTTGLHTSLKYNDEGKPFVAYYFDNPTRDGVDALMFAYCAVTNGTCDYAPIENTWRCHTFVSGEGLRQYPSLVVRNNWDWYISYYNGGNGELWYARTIDESPGNYGLDLTGMTC